MSENIERAPWRTSSYSGNQGDCVEVAPLWRTSSYSGNQGQCVEVAPLPETIGVRDTKDRTRGHFTVTRTTWAAFTRATASGELTR